MAKETDTSLYSIVVVGQMNPRIHHPQWYHRIGCLSDEEMDAAVESDEMVCVPPIASFSVSGVAVVVQDARWEIRTADRGTTGRMLEIAGAVFAALEHTPVSGFGFNINLRRATSINDVGAYLAHLVLSSGLGLVIREGEASGEVILRSSYPGGEGASSRSVTVRIGSGKGEASGDAWIRHNFHYQLEPDSSGEPFDLRTALQTRFDRDMCEAEEHANQIARSMTASGASRSEK